MEKRHGEAEEGKRVDSRVQAGLRIVATSYSNLVLTAELKTQLSRSPHHS